MAEGSKKQKNKHGAFLDIKTDDTISYVLGRKTWPIPGIYPHKQNTNPHLSLNFTNAYASCPKQAIPFFPNPEVISQSKNQKLNWPLEYHSHTLPQDPPIYYHRKEHYMLHQALEY